MLVRALLAAIFAGMLAGVFTSAVQSVRVIPLILEAEVYEDGAAVHDQDHDGGETAMVEHSQDGEAWAPADGWQRTLFTVISNIVLGVAFALILTAVILATGQPVSAKAGLLWGIGGFAAFVLAPNFGLPPELPGMPAAGLVERQTWWVATVVMTGGGLLILALRRALPWMLAGVALIVAPHVYGAPKPPAEESAVPAGLAADFVIATVVTSALFWLVLGGLLGYFLARALKAEGQAASHA